MADFNLPTLASTYTDFLNELTARDLTAIRMLSTEYTTDTNIPAGAIRWNNSTFKYEKYSGASWADLATLYAISISGTSAKLAAGTTNEMVYQSAASTTAFLGVNATATHKFLRQFSSGAPAWSQIDISEITGAIAETGGNYNFDIASATVNSDMAYAAIEIREANHAGTQTGVVGEAPRLAFNWSGRVSAQMGIGTDGVLRTFDTAGTGYADFKAKDIAGVIGTFTGEARSTSSNAFRAVSGNYGLILRNDGTDVLLLATNSADQYGTYNSLRPFKFALATGAVTMANGATISELTISGTATAVNVTATGVLKIASTATGVMKATSGVVSAISTSESYQAFTASGTWTKPSWCVGTELVEIDCWGGGGGGSVATYALRTGGGGGAYAFGRLLASNLGATETILIGSGGAIDSTGTDSTFGTAGTGTNAALVPAFGGGRGYTNGSTINTGGGGGGGKARGSTNTSGGATYALARSAGGLGWGTVDTGGYGGGGVTGGYSGTSRNGEVGQDSTNGGGGGGSSTGSSDYATYIGHAGGNSIFGGGGGGGSYSTTSHAAGGASKYGKGNGGAGNVAGTIPGGGGGSGAAGARGEIRVRIIL